MKTVGAILVVILIVAGIAILASNKKGENTNSDNQAGQTEANVDLKIEDLKVGEGAEAKAGNLVKVNYTGTLTDGTKFDSSYDRNEPFEFTLGAGQVIEGWDKGFAGMKVGGQRKLTIPPSMGYGDQTVGSIPANSTLVFEVELLEVK